MKIPFDPVRFLLSTIGRYVYKLTLNLWELPDLELVLQRGNNFVSNFPGFPFWCEEFSLSILDEKPCVVLAITSNPSSIPEVTGGSAITASRADEIELLSVLEKLRIDESKRKMLRIRGFGELQDFPRRGGQDKLLRLIRGFMRRESD